MSASQRSIATVCALSPISLTARRSARGAQTRNNVLPSLTGRAPNCSCHLAELVSTVVMLQSHTFQQGHRQRRQHTREPQLFVVRCVVRIELAPCEDVAVASRAGLRAERKCCVIPLLRLKS